MANDGNAVFQVRGGSAAEWTAANPTLLVNEFGFETDTSKFKVGDGVKAWADLAYWSGGYNTIRTGTVDPVDTLGTDGDFYINRTNNRIFGPKTAGVWGNGTSMVGPSGTNGRTILSGTTAPAAGAGADGDFYINTTAHTVFGPKTGGAWGTGTPLVGPQGPQGIQGPAGPQGDQGPQGPQGPSGADGADGTDGKTVLNGTVDPAAGAGVDGDFYINTSTTQIFGPKTAGAWGGGTSLVGSIPDPYTPADGKWNVTGSISVSVAAYATKFDLNDAGAGTYGLFRATSAVQVRTHSTGTVSLQVGAVDVAKADASSLKITGKLNLSAIANATPADGDVWYDSAEGKFKKRESGVTSDLGGGSSAGSSGTYTPTATAISNITTATPSVAQWMRVGNTVTLSGKITLKATTGSLLTEVEISLPVASAFTTDSQAGGIATCDGATANEVLGIKSSNSGKLRFSWKSVGNAQKDFWFTATYQVV